MNRTVRGVVFAAALAALALGAGAAAAKPGNAHGNGGGKGRPERARTEMTIPNAGTGAGPDADAAGRIDVKHFPPVGRRAERSWLRFKLRKLDAMAGYTLWIDDPATADDDLTLTQIGEAFTTDGEGEATLRFDTKKGGELPFGATLDDLADQAAQVRDGAGAVVLEGTIPAGS